MRIHLVLHFFANGLVNSHVRIELRKHNLATNAAALDGSFHFDAVCCLEPSVPTLVSSVSFVVAYAW